MFVVTIGPLKWGNIVKVLAIGIVLLLIALVAWRIMASLSPAEQPLPPDGEVVTVIGQQLGTSLWNRFLHSLQQYFRGGF